MVKTKKNQYWYEGVGTKFNKIYIKFKIIYLKAHVYTNIQWSQRRGVAISVSITT